MNTCPTFEFGIRHPHQLATKLVWEWLQLHDSVEKGEREIAAFQFWNFAVTAWSLAEWTFEALPDAHRQKFAGLRAFENSLKQESILLAACRDIATHAKHFTIRSSRASDIAFDSTPDAGGPIIILGAWRLGLNTFGIGVLEFWTCKLKELDLMPAWTKELYAAHGQAL